MVLVLVSHVTTASLGDLANAILRYFTLEGVWHD